MALFTIHAELTATCNSLGCAGAEKYVIDPQCSEAIRDLIKFLRRDGDDHEIRRFLGSANIVETDLLPILVEYSDKPELFDLIVRLLVNLTTPALLVYNEQLPAEKQPRQYYLQILLHLQKYKRAFTDVKVWNVIVDKLAEVMQAEYYEKGNEKVLSTVRLLILVRNILHVPADNDAECRPDNDASLHDQVLWAMHQSQLIDIIMYIACSNDEQQYYLHALEIISLMLRDQNAAELADASVNRTISEKCRDEHELKLVLEKEQKEKIQKLKKYSGSRHSKFGGRFVVSGMKSIGDNEMVVSSMTSNVNKAFDRYKKPLKTPRNRMPLKDGGIERKSAFSVRLFLKEFCVEFLHGAYNTFMKQVRELLVRSKGQPNDESYYFWAMQFFMEFNRNYRFEIKLVSETMALNIFHFVQERIEESREKLLTDKKKIPIWSKRMHLGLKAYKELMETLLVMYQNKDPMMQSSARTILTNLFYMVEYRDFLLSLLNLYNEVKFSRTYLKDLIETNHIFMKLLEHTGKQQRNLVVLCKPKTKKATKKSKPSAQVIQEDDDTMWTNLNIDLKKIIQMPELVIDVNEAKPYDPVSEVSMEDQKIEAMCRIRMHIRTKHLEKAIKLLRASREVWPEDNYFGKPGLSNNDELDVLKQIFYADLGLPTVYDDENVIESNNQNDDEKDQENDDEDEDEEESSQIRMEEKNFEFLDFVKKFANPKVLQSCCQLLKEFDTNSTYTNHAIVKLLHRITYDCKYSSLMFQASVFRVFQKIFASKNPNHKELKHFAVYIMRKFTDVTKKNNKVFIELLFWKELKTAFEIEEGYDADHKKVTNWSEEQEDELHRLHDEYVRDMPEEDEVLWILKNLIRQDRSRISVVKKMKQIGINPIKNKKKPNKEFSEAEIVQITQLVQEFREASNPMQCIMNKLDVKRIKKHVVDKIVELGLVGDRKELRRKKSKNINKSNHQEYSSSDESNESESDKEIDDSTYHSLTSIYVLNAIKKVLDKDMKPALLWLIDSLDEAAEDLDVDESDIPLLPLTDECMTAVNDKDFQEMMHILGIHKPSSIQETFWRIPGKWQANDIHQRSITIKNVIEGTFVAENNTNAISRIDDSSDEDVGATFDRIRKSLAQNNNDTQITNRSLKTNPSKTIDKHIELNKETDSNKPIFLSEDSDVEDEIISVQKKVTLNNLGKVDGDADKRTVLTKKIRTLLEDSDEDVKVAPNKKKIMSIDTDDSDVEENAVSLKNKQTIRSSDEDDPSPIKKTIMSMNNDEEIMKKNNISKTNKKSFFEDSDDDDDNVKEVMSIKNKISLDISKGENKINTSLTKTKRILESSDEDDSILVIEKNVLCNSDKNNSDLEKCANSKKKELLLHDNDKEENVWLDNTNEKDNVDIKKNTVSMKKKKRILESSDEEDNSSPIIEKNVMLYDSHKDDSDMEKSVISKKGKILLENSDEEENILLGNTNDKNTVSMRKKKRMLESSDEEDSNSTVEENLMLYDSDKDNRNVEKSIVSKKKKILLEDSDGEDRDVPLKKKALLVDFDSDEENNSLIKNKKMLKSNNEDDCNLINKKVILHNSDKDIIGIEENKEKNVLLQDNDVEDVTDMIINTMSQSNENVAEKITNVK